ncbi:uncharacterized protein N7459_005482 [Penicillium hispanicum]|uniref:uncharacterized protein n=1 Tax=Penicillium hispanicum TaxID=1080232 RepID=UPI00254073A3|nr:uncharacterized protein N7459_005482 [Penicillium hispanicum]KAJ5579497.1 hypothetical protein N7459_005482 [Penicillium hispanicum]
MVFVAKLLSHGLGFTSEAIHALRDRQSSRQPASSAIPDADATADPRALSVPTDPETNTSFSRQPTRVDDEANQHDEWATNQTDEASYSLNQDEAAWELDDMAERMRSPAPEGPTYDGTAESEDVKINRREAMVRKLIVMAGPPPERVQPLPCPVIIPQTRPRNKDRGFVHAYAPVLADCGISQGVFLEFLDDLKAANKASAWIEVTFLAGAIVGCVPFMSAQIVSAVVQVIAGTARELQGRQRANTFLGRVNQEIFMPRGLYAMVMAFKDELPRDQQDFVGRLSSSLGKKLFASEKVDINQTAAKYMSADPNQSKFRKGLDSIRLTSGTTRGDIELPQAAELVYPDLDWAASQVPDGSEPAGIRDKLQGASTWTQRYFDNRSHAFYEAEHPGSALVVPASQRAPLKSRFNDPNHPANSGSLISVVTGGLIPMPGIDRLVAETQAYILRGGSPRDPQSDGKLAERTATRMIKKKLQKEVLYLIIVKLPTEEELQQSVSDLDQMMEQVGATMAAS